MINIKVTTLTGMSKTLQVAPSSTVEEFKAQVQKSMGFPVAMQRIVYSSKQLHNGVTLADYGLKDNDTVHLLLRLEGYDPARPPYSVLADRALAEQSPQEALTAFRANV